MNSKYLLVYRSNVAPSHTCSKDRINQSRVLTQDLWKDRTHSVPCTGSFRGITITRAWISQREVQLPTADSNPSRPRLSKKHVTALGVVVKMIPHAASTSRANGPPVHTPQPPSCTRWVLPSRAQSWLHLGVCMHGCRNYAGCLGGVGANRKPQPSGLGSQEAQNP